MKKLVMLVILAGLAWVAWQRLQSGRGTTEEAA